jgi:phage/plasmid-associated DNA primase
MDIPLPTLEKIYAEKCKGGLVPGVNKCENPIFENGLCEQHFRICEIERQTQELEKLKKMAEEQMKKEAEEREKVRKQETEQKEKVKREVNQKRQANYNTEAEIFQIFDPKGFVIGYECKTEINDRVAMSIFKKIKKDELQKDGDDILIFDNNTGMWKRDPNFIKKEIMESALRLYHISFNEELNEWVRAKKCSDYSGTISNIEKLYKALQINMEDSKFIEKNIESSIGKLLFADGIYDFNTNTFSKGFNSKIIFFNRIERNFPSKPNYGDIRYLEHILFDNLFETEEISNFVKRFITYSIYGDYRIRKSCFAMGETGSGKGMITEALYNAFPGIVEQFDADNFLFNKSSKDKAQMLMWLKNLKTVRLAISNEIQLEKDKHGKIITKINGNIFKSVISGGDSIEVRGMNENIYKMINRANFMFCANDFPEFYPLDNAIKDRVENVSFYKSFKETPNPKNPFELKRDTTIKSKIKEERYKDALFWIIANTYQNQIKGKDYIPAPIEFIEEEIDNSNCNELEMFENTLLEFFDFTDSEEIEKADKVENKDIDAIIADRLGWTKNKILSIFKKFRKIKNMKFETKVSHGKTYRSNIKKKLANI